MKKITLTAVRVNAGLTIKNAAPPLGVGKDTLIRWEKEPETVNNLFSR